MNNIASKIETEVSSDGSGQGLLRVGLSHHHAASLGSVFALPNHGNNGAGRNEADELVVERLASQVDVVLFDVLRGSLHELHGDEFEAALFESLDDVADEAALDAIWLHHDESAVGVRHVDRLVAVASASQHK